MGNYVKSAIISIVCLQLISTVTHTDEVLIFKPFNLFQFDNLNNHRTEFMNHNTSNVPSGNMVLPM